MKYANKIGAMYSLILGDDEVDLGKASVKNMETGETTEINISEIGAKMKELLNL